VGTGWLIPLDGAQTGELFELRADRTVVGSSPDCDVMMVDPSISGRHAEFTATAHGFRVSDLGSTDGTYVNGKRVSSEDLADDDSLRMGRVNFRFKFRLMS
jgi:pSer/pThr/pTyr-binding forkhead associated (FHA) protein